MADRMRRARRVMNWVVRCFGINAMGPRERSARFLEEAIELVQASGLERREALELVAYVYSRPVGDLPQEVGGVSVSLLGLCAVMNVDADAEEIKELERIESIPSEHFRKRHAVKVEAGVARAPEPTPSDKS